MRDFEISNLWQRSIFLSAILVLLFTGYGFLVINLIDNSSPHTTIFIYLDAVCMAFCAIGFLFSIIWIMMAKGSKAWYEIYEKRICYIERKKKLGIRHDFRLGADTSPDNINNDLLSTEAGQFSPSKLNIIIGIFMAFIWVSTYLIHFFLLLYNIPLDNLTRLWIPIFSILLTSITIFLGFFFYAKAKSHSIS